MRFEAWHSGLLGRPDIVAVDMIHYGGLWGLSFSHHPPHNNYARYAADTTTAGVMRYLAESDSDRGTPLSALAAHTVTTHHVDADSALPVWAFLNPEAALERRAQMERIARCGDFFIHIDDETAKVNFTIEELHRRLRGAGMRGERMVDENLTGACFEWLLPRMGALLATPDQFAEYWDCPMRAVHADLDYLAKHGRVTEMWEQHASFVETDRELDPHALNTACRNDLLVLWHQGTGRRELIVRPAIGWYELTSVPHRPRYDLARLCEELNRAERQAGSAHDEPWEHDAGAVSLSVEHSLLTREALCEAHARWLATMPEELLPSAYRADMRDYFPRLPRHAVFSSFERFASAAEVSYRPGGQYGGLYPAGQQRMSGGLLISSAGKSPMPFSVADEYCWGCRPEQSLTLHAEVKDVSEGTLRVEYDAWNGEPHRSTTPVQLCGDGEVKRFTFALPGARMANGQEQGADFRLARSPGTAFALKSLVLRKSGEWTGCPE